MTDVQNAVSALTRHVEDIYALFLDSRHGFTVIGQQLGNVIHDLVKHGKSHEEALKTQLASTDGIPFWVVPARQWSTVGAALFRTADGGRNEIVLSGLVIASIYAFWESRARGEIAKAMGIKHNDVRSDLMNDLRHLRHAILHCDGVADLDVERADVLKWFKRGDRIKVSNHQLHQIVELVRLFPEGLQLEVVMQPAVPK
jgi:hypothetical protein